MKYARVYISEYGTRQVGEINDVVDQPAGVLEGILKEVEVPDDFNMNIMTAVIAEDGSITFEEDAAKVAEQLEEVRAGKLTHLRALRSAKLMEVDIMVNDLALGDTSLTQVQIKDYRQALKDVTEPFKEYATDEDHATALDALDVPGFVWPVKPS